MTLARDRYDPDELVSQLAAQRPGKDGSEWCFQFKSYNPAIDTDDFMAYLPRDERQHAEAQSRLASFLSEIRTLDNAFQESCEEDLRTTDVSLADVKLHIGWLSVAGNIVTVRYWGTVVNTEFEMRFQQNQHGAWSEVASTGTSQ